MITSRSVRERTVTIYANSWCPHSKRSRNLLSQIHIPFNNIDFDLDSAAARQVEAWNDGDRSSPTIIIHQVLTEPSIIELERVFIASDALVLDLDVYMTSWCPDCRRTLAWLKENGIAFRSFDIDKDSAAAARVSAWNQGNLSVPTLSMMLRVTEPSSDQLLAALGLGSQS
jgi:glutaredoxin